MRRRTRMWIAMSASVSVILAVVALDSSLVFGESSPSHLPDAPTHPDATPAGTPSLAASTHAPDGERLGIVTYRNNDGAVCIAAGRLNPDGRLGNGHDRHLPLADAGDCTTRPDPVAVTVTNVGDDPTTPRDEAGVVISGRADGDVATIDVALGDDRRNVMPGDNGAFILALGAPGDPTNNVRINAHMHDGSSQEIVLPAPPSLDAITKGAEAHRPGSDEHH
jgi:hypothetical protein